MAILENKITLDSSQYEEATRRVNEATQEVIKLLAKNKRSVDALVKSYAQASSDALADSQEKLAEASKKAAEGSEKAAKKIKETKKAKEEATEAAKLLINSLDAEAKALEQLKQMAKDGGTSLNALDKMHLKLNGSMAELVGFSGRAVASLQVQRDAAYDAAKAQEELAKANIAAMSGGDGGGAKSNRFNEWVKEVEKGKEAIAKPVDMSWLDAVNAKTAIELQKTRDAQAKQREEAAKTAAELKALIPTQELVNFSTRAMGISSEEYRETLRKLQEQAKAAGWSMDALGEGFLHASEGQYKLITLNGTQMADTAKLTTSARAYGLTMQEQEQRTQKLRDAAYKQGATMNELSATYLKVTDNSYKLVDANGRVYASLEKNAKGTREATEAQKAFIKHQGELKANLAKIASMAAVAFSFRELVRASDEITEFNNKIKNATNGLAEFRDAKKGVIEIAAKTGQELSAVGNIYQSIRSSIGNLNISEKEAIKLTDTLSKAIAVNGASAQASSASLYQLGQAFASGQLRGEELNSVLKQTPEVAKAIADGMGVPVGALKRLAAEGKLTGEEVAKALLKSSDVIDGRFKNATITISGAMNTLKTRFMEWVDGANNSTGAGEKLAKAIVFVSDNINVLATSAAAFIALKMSISIIKTTVEVVNFGKSVLASNAIQKKGVANNIAYAKSLDAVGLSAKKATIDLQAMNAAEFMGKRGMTSWAGRTGGTGMLANAGRASMAVTGMGLGAAILPILVTIAASLAVATAAITAIKVARRKDGENFISNGFNSAWGFDNEARSMGTALFDLTEDIKKFTDDVKKSGSLLDTYTKHVSDSMTRKIDEFKKIDFWKEVTRFLTGNKGDYKKSPNEPDVRLNPVDAALVGTYEEQIKKLQRLNETFGMTEEQIRKFDFDKQIAGYEKQIATAKDKNDVDIESAKAARSKLISVNFEIEQLKEKHAIQQQEIEQKKKLKEIDEKNAKVFDEFKKKEEERIKSINDVILGLMEQKATLGMTSNELVKFKAAMSDATESQLKAIDAHQKYIDAFEKDAKAKQTIAELKEQEQMTGKNDTFKRVWQESKNGASRKQLVEIQDILNKIADKSGREREYVDITEIMRKTGNKNYGGFSGLPPSSTESKKLTDQAKDMGKLDLSFDFNGKTISGAVMADPEFVKQLHTLTTDSMNKFLNQEAKKAKN